MRAGDSLILRLADGGRKVLTDTLLDSLAGEQTRRFLYRGLDARLHAFHVEAFFWEASGSLLIDAPTGEQTELWGAPVVAPGGQRFATASYDLDADYNPNGIQIWRVASRAPKLEWQQVLTTWGPSNVAWIDDSTLLVTAGFGARNLAAHACYQVIRREGRWKVVAAPLRYHV